MNECKLIALASLALVVSFPVASWADGEGERVMKLMDKYLTLADDQYLELECITSEPGKQERRMKFKVYMKGTQWRRVEFVSPGDIKGTRVLILSRTQMYVYLPAYRRIRRVASHVMDQGFMGTAFSQADMATMTFFGVLEPKLLEETETHWKLEGTRRPGNDFPYARVEFDVRKDYRQPSETRYFNEKSLKLKTETRTNYECTGKFCSPLEINMTDHNRNDISSVLLRKVWKLNQGLEDRFFTVRSIQRGR